MSYAQLLNPLTGAPSFGVVPKMKLTGVVLEQAEIHLFLGKHHAPNRGFGARHIWAEHQAEMAKAGLMTQDLVSHFVLRIIKSGTPLYFEGASWRTTRIMAVRSAIGQAVLEHREQRNGAIWSIVTAFAATKTHGTLVGTVR